MAEIGIEDFTPTAVGPPVPTMRDVYASDRSSSPFIFNLAAISLETLGLSQQTKKLSPLDPRMYLPHGSHEQLRSKNRESDD